MDVKDWVKGVEDKIEALGTDVRTANGMLAELEQKAAAGAFGGGSGGEAATIGREFVEAKAAELEAMSGGGRRGTVRLETKATITTGTAGTITPPSRDALVQMPKRRLTIRALLSQVPVTSGSVEYPQQTTRNLNAAMQVEAQAKAESELGYEIQTAPIRTVAHFIPASVQVLADVPQLQGLIDQDLRYGLALKEEEQLLFGSGTGVNLTGMATLATPYAAPAGMTGDNMIDQLGLAILQAALTDTPPDGIVVHDADWWRMRLLKDADGKYLLGDPGANPAPVLFGLPVVATKAMTVDKFLLGAFGAQTLYDRQQATVDVSTEHADFFIRNLVAIRCEERIGLAVKHPEALIYGDFGNVA